MSETERWPVYHRHCRGIAFYTRVRLSAGEMLTAAIVEMPDYTRPIAGTRIYCGACGDACDVSDLTYHKTHVDDIGSDR